MHRNSSCSWVEHNRGVVGRLRKGSNTSGEICNFIIGSKASDNKGRDTHLNEVADGEREPENFDATVTYSAVAYFFVEKRSSWRIGRRSSQVLPHIADECS